MNIEDNGKKEYTEDEMALRIPLLSDIVFKYIFGSEQSTEILKTFINAVLKDYGYTEITTVKVTNPFNDKTYFDEKYSVIDTRAEDEQGKKYNIEVQLRTGFDYKERSLYYWAKSYSEQLEEAELYGDLKGVVSISILNYIQFPEHIPFHSCFMLRENNSPEDVLTGDCMMHYLEVPKLRVRQLESELENWLYFLAFCDKEVENMKYLLDDNPAMKAAKERYDYFVADKKARIAYQQREKFLRDQANYIYTAKMEGIAEGIEKTAMKMLDEGIAVEVIGKVTGLSKERVEELQTGRVG